MCGFRLGHLLGVLHLWIRVRPTADTPKHRPARRPLLNSGFWILDFQAAFRLLRFLTVPRLSCRAATRSMTLLFGGLGAAAGLF